MSGVEFLRCESNPNTETHASECHHVSEYHPAGVNPEKTWEGECANRDGAERIHDDKCHTANDAVDLEKGLEGYS